MIKPVFSVFHTAKLRAAIAKSFEAWCECESHRIAPCQHDEKDEPSKATMLVPRRSKEAEERSCLRLFLPIVVVAASKGNHHSITLAAAL